MSDKKKMKTDPAVLALLASPKEDEVLEMLLRLREIGNPLYLPRLLDMLLEAPSPQVSGAILTMLGEAKFRETARYLAEAISEERFFPVRKQLLACCWQNGLDYSPWFPLLVQLTVHSPFETAFEAFTIIENMNPLPPVEIRNEAIALLTDALPASQGNQNYLIRELLSILTG